MNTVASSDTNDFVTGDPNNLELTKALANLSDTQYTELATYTKFYLSDAPIQTDPVETSFSYIKNDQLGVITEWTNMSRLGTSGITYDLNGRLAHIKFKTRIEDVKITHLETLDSSVNSNEGDPHSFVRGSDSTGLYIGIGNELLPIIKEYIKTVQ